MKAAVHYAPGDTRIEEVTDPKCPPGGVVIRVKAVGICGSDVRTHYSGSHKISEPMVLGHEAAGEVIECDDAHETFKIGDGVAMAPGIFCTKCYYCRSGMTTMCENLTELGFQYPGGFAEYMAIPGIAFQRGRIVGIPDGLSFDQAAVCEPPSSCIMAQERANVSLGESVVILGAGPIGCLQVQVARARGAANIMIIDTAPQRLESARPFGADSYIDPGKEDPVEKVRELTGGLGADKVIVAAPSAVAQQQSVEMARRQGTVVFFGGLPKDKPCAELNTNTVHYRDVIIMGHYGQEKRHVALALDMIARGQINTEKLITDVLPLDEIIKGFELVRDKKALKVLLRP